MPRVYPAHGFHGIVTHNTNYPPQSNNEHGGGPPSGEIPFLLEEHANFLLEDDRTFLLEEST